MFFFILDNMKEYNILRRKEEIWNFIESEEIRNIYGRRYFDGIYNSIIEGFGRYFLDLISVIRAVRSGLLLKRFR